VGLLAALPVGWSASALAQNTTGWRTSDTGINPLDDTSPLTRDQRKAQDIDQKLGNPGSSLEQKEEPTVGNRSDTMGAPKENKVPSAVDTKEIQRSSGKDTGATGLDRETQLKDETNLGNEENAKPPKKKGAIEKEPKSDETVSPDTSDRGIQHRMDDRTPHDSTNYDK
jgi:hypothetical protein